MANSITHAATPWPVKGARWSILIPYLDADGDPTDPTTPDTEISVDGGAFADCAEEAAALTGSNGVCLLTVTGAETNYPVFAIAAKAASGPKATLGIFRPRLFPVLTSGTAQAGGAATITLASGASAITDYYVGCVVKTTGGTGGGGTGGANNQARIITAYNGSTKVATVNVAWETNPDSSTTYEVQLCETALLCAKPDVSAWGGTAAASAVVLADMVQVSGDATAADNLESQFDGTGLTGDTYPATQAGLVTNITNVMDIIPAIDGTHLVTLANVAHGGAAATLTLTTTDFGTVTTAGWESTGVWNLNGGLGVAGIDLANGTPTLNQITGVTGGSLPLATIFTGMTNIAHWLGALAGKQAANATAQTEIRATGAGSGTYDATTDSLESIRDNASAPTAAAVADAVWDEAIAGHAGAGSTGAALAAAQSAGDPWSTALPGAYAAGTAGYMVGSIFVLGQVKNTTQT